MRSAPCVAPAAVLAACFALAAPGIPAAVAQDTGAAPAAAAAAPAASAAAPEAELPQGPIPVRVLSLGGLAGAASGVAADLMAARELVALEVNAAGGLADGRPLALEPVDVGCAGAETEETAAITREALDRAAAVAILGPVCSDAALKAADAAVALGAPMISDAATVPALSELEDEDLVFRTAPADGLAAAAMADLAGLRGVTSVAVAHAGDAWAEGLAGAFAEAAREEGINVVAVQAFAPGLSSYAAETALLAESASADALVLFAYAGGDGPAFLSAALKEGAWGAVLGGDGLLDDALARAVGTLKMARVTLVAPSPDRGSEAWRRFSAAAEAQGLDPEAPLAAQGYDAAMVMALALVRSGAEGGPALAKAIREVTRAGAPRVLPGDWARARALAEQGPVQYVGASGDIAFDDAGDVPGRFAAWKVQAGGWKPGRMR